VTHALLSSVKSAGDMPRWQGAALPHVLPTIIRKSSGAGPCPAEGILRRTNSKTQRRPSSAAGITLIEMMIVVTIIALVAGVSYPSITSGLDSLRLRSATNSIVSLLNTALDRADRRQQAVEILISPKEEAIIARSVDPGFNHRIELQDAIRITSVLPAAEVDPAETRRFLLYPGGTVPRIAIELTNSSGRKRLVSIDPVTGVPQAK